MLTNADFSNLNLIGPRHVQVIFSFNSHVRLQLARDPTHHARQSPRRSLMDMRALCPVPFLNLRARHAPWLRARLIFRFTANASSHCPPLLSPSPLPDRLSSSQSLSSSSRSPLLQNAC